MGCPPTREAPDPSEPQRWAFDFSVAGDLRFISHRDTLRLFERALARSGLPVRYSQGFNPHPRISIPLPRPVGVASDAEAIVVDFSEPIDGPDARHRLDEQTPRDITVTGDRLLRAGERLHACRARYQIELDAPADDNVRTRIRRTLESTEIIIERTNPKTQRTKLIDVRPYLATMATEGRCIVYTLCITGAGTLKPSEAAALAGLDPHLVNHRTRRLNVEWEHSNRE